MGAVDSQTIWFGILQFATLILILALLYRPLGDYIARVYTSREGLAGRARLLPRDRRRPGIRADLAGLPARRSGLLGRWASCSSTRCSACRRCCRTRSGCLPCPRGSPSTPRSRSSRTRTGSRTRPSSRSATPCSSPGSPCRTSSPPPSASPSPSPSSAASPLAARTPSATSGSTWFAARSGCCCPCRSSRRSRC